MFFMVKRNNLFFLETLQTSIQSNPAHFDSAAPKCLYLAGETRGRPVSLCHQKPKQFASRLTIRFVARLVFVSDSILFSGWAVISVRCCGRQTGVRGE